jgi:hypothetical protein
VYNRWCDRSRGKPQHPSDLRLDVAAMQEAASHLVGSLQDFSTFADTRRPSGNAEPLEAHALSAAAVLLTAHFLDITSRQLHTCCTHTD